jgi:polyisoprenoid-binding protein YceI
MKHFFLSTVFVAGLSMAQLIGPAQSRAADDFAIDAAHTNIVFLIDHLGYSTMIGQFQDFAGDFAFDQENVANSKVAITIQAASVDTDHDARDDHLRSPDFFNVEEFPEITFVSTGAEKIDDNSGKIMGDLTLMGVTKPVTLDVTFNQLSPHPIPSYEGVLVAGFSARTTIDRTEFGMGYAAGAIGNEVEFWLEVEGHKK